MKHFLAVVITLLPSVALAQQFTPKQLIEVMAKSPSNRDVRVHDAQFEGLNSDWGCTSAWCEADDDGAY